MRMTKTASVAASGLLLAFCCCSSYAAICRVTTGGVSTNDGSTWTAPLDLQTALVLGGPCTEVWVATGSYKPTTDSNISASFHVYPGIALYGGFAGNETQRDQRNFNLNVTTLSGDIGTVGVAADNVVRVVTMIGSPGNPITATTVIDGFTISGAYSSGYAGGGIYCSAPAANTECSPTLANLVLEGNRSYAGAGIGFEAGSGGVSNATLSNIAITGNTDVSGGGGIAIYGDDGMGGGTVNLVIDGVTVSGNHATGDAGGAFRIVGAPSACSVAVTNATLSGNTTVYSGGAIWAVGCSLSLTNVTIANNNAGGSGGAIQDQNSSYNLENVIIWGNTCAGAACDQIVTSTPVSTIAASSIIAGGCPTGATCIGVGDSDPQLGPLQDNGGPTETMLPALGSPAIGGGYNATCAATDQRGVRRPQGANCDIGAVELVLDRVFADNFDARPTP